MAYCRIPIRFATRVDGFRGAVELRAGVLAGEDERGCALCLPAPSGRRCPCAITPSSKRARLKLHRRAALADDERRDRRFRCWCSNAADVESGALELALEVTRVGPEPLDALRLVLQDVEGGDAGGRDRRRMRRGEQERPRAVVEVVDQVADAADVAAQRADGFRQRAHLHVDTPVHAKVIDDCRGRCGPARPRRARRRPS